MAESRQDRLLSADRLSFLIAFVPWLAARERSTVGEAARHFGVSEELIRQTVLLVAMSGRPGETRWADPLPDEMFDIDWEAFEERDELVLTHVLDLETAPRFSAREAAAVIAGLQYLAGLPETDGSARIAALQDKLSRGTAGTPSRVGVVSTGADPERLARIREATDRGVQLEFTYLNEQGRRARRTVDPLRIESADDNWYLRAWCHLRDAVRTFRLDRITDLTVTSLPVGHTASDVALGDELFTPAGDDLDVTVELPADALPLLGDFLVDAKLEDLGHGRVRATLRVAHVHGIKRLAARMPGIFTVIAPTDARVTVYEWASTALRAYS